MGKFSSFIVWTMLLNCLVIIQSSSPIVYRTSLKSSSDKRMSINKNANKIAIVDLNISQITIFEKSIEKNSYTPTILNVNNFKPSNKLFDDRFSNSDHFIYNKIHLNDEGNMLYYVDTNNYLVMADISGGNVVVSTIHQCLANREYSMWTGVDDNIVLFCYQANNATSTIYLYHKGVKTNQLNVNNNNYDIYYNSGMYYRQIKLLKDPFLLIQPFSWNVVNIFNIDSSFSNIQNPQIFNWTGIYYQEFYKKSFYFYNHFSSQIWRVTCHNSLSDKYNVSSCLYPQQNLVRKKLDGNLQPPIAQNLNVGNELFISKNGKYFVILNNFEEKSVLKMYNLEEVTRVGSLNGVLVELQLTDSCQITNLQINQQGNKIVYVCVKYLQKTELVVVEHTLGVYDAYGLVGSGEQPNNNNRTISLGYNYMLFVGFCFATFLLFLVVLCFIVVLFKYRRISNRIAQQVQLQFKNAMSRHEKQIYKLKFKNLQINQSKSHSSQFHDVPELRDSKTTFSRKTVVPCQVTWS